MNLKGSNTEKNLITALRSESEARNKYEFFASKAKQEQYMDVYQVFMETSKNEKEHAEIWYKILYGEVGSTKENLETAANLENHEWSDLYSKFAEEAKNEGFNEIATLFEGVANIEKRHEQRFLDLLTQMKSDEMFKKSSDQEWICTNCGHVHYGPEACQVCPVCSHTQGYFKIQSNYRKIDLKLDKEVEEMEEDIYPLQKHALMEEGDVSAVYSEDFSDGYVLTKELTEE